MSFLSSEQIHSQVRALLTQISGGRAFTDDQDVFATSIIRSMNLLELIVSIEDTYGIVVSERDVFEGRLRSVQQLAGFIVGAVRS